ncbi:hypothetical protein FOZ60_009889 [Perkinsus olseni]|uniref:Uncharacterized protein n=1 Tax=Perkinsus olseni TaxID=32597 RepID=A0A7J6PNG9_PEROL|nr:hypothetical protein FOZ60_009889 [Perkinsus olseni]
MLIRHLIIGVSAQILPASEVLRALAPDTSPNAYPPLEKAERDDFKVECEFGTCWTGVGRGFMRFTLLDNEGVWLEHIECRVGERQLQHAWFSREGHIFSFLVEDFRYEFKEPPPDNTGLSPLRDLQSFTASDQRGAKDICLNATESFARAYPTFESLCEAVDDAANEAHNATLEADWDCDVGFSDPLRVTLFPRTDD